MKQRRTYASFGSSKLKLRRLCALQLWWASYGRRDVFGIPYKDNELVSLKQNSEKHGHEDITGLG